MKKINFFSYLGGPGGPLCRTQVNEIFRAVRPHSRADIILCITREKHNCQFFIYGPQYTKFLSYRENDEVSADADAAAAAA